MGRGGGSGLESSTAASQRNLYGASLLSSQFCFVDGVGRRSGMPQGESGSKSSTSELRLGLPRPGWFCSAFVEKLGGLETIAPHVDFDRVWLGGHSAGGTVALHNSNPAWISGLSGVFAYGAHTMMSTSLGHGEVTVAQVPSGVPILLLAGAEDGVIAASRDRYRFDKDDGHDPVARTFSDGVTRNEGDSFLVVVRDANHFTICDPIDETSGRSFLESDLRADDAATRGLLADLVVAFIDGRLTDAVQADGVATWEKR